MQLTHGSPLRKQATSACLVKRQSQETKPDPLLATRVRGTLTQPGCVPMPAKMKSPTPPSMKECLPKPKSFSGRMTLLRKVSFASLGPWGRAAPAQQHLLRASCAAAGGLGECVTKSAANAGHCFFKLALRCSTGTLHDHSADPPAAHGAAAGDCSFEAGLTRAAAAGHKVAHSKTRVEPEDSISSRQAFLSLKRCSKRASRQAHGSRHLGCMAMQVWQ